MPDIRKVRAVRAAACPWRNKGAFLDLSRNLALPFHLLKTRSCGMLPPVVTTDIFRGGAAGPLPSRRSSFSRGGVYASVRGGTVRRMSARDAHASVDSDASVSSPDIPTDENGIVVVGTLTNARNALTKLTNMGEGTLQLVSVPLPGSPSERSLGILWRKVSSAPYFQSVRVRLTTAYEMLGEETLTWQRFPPSSAGMLSLSSIPSGTTRVAVELRLLPSEDPDSWMRALTAQCFGEPHPLFIACRLARAAAHGAKRQPMFFDRHAKMSALPSADLTSKSGAPRLLFRRRAITSRHCSVRTLQKGSRRKDRSLSPQGTILKSACSRTRTTRRTRFVATFTAREAGIARIQPRRTRKSWCGKRPTPHTRLLLSGSPAVASSSRRSNHGAGQNARIS